MTSTNEQHPNVLDDPKMQDFMAGINECLVISALNLADSHERLSKFFDNIAEQYQEAAVLSPENLASYLSLPDGQAGEILLDQYQHDVTAIWFFRHCVSKHIEVLTEFLGKFKALDEKADEILATAKEIAVSTHKACDKMQVTEPNCN